MSEAYDKMVTTLPVLAAVDDAFLEAWKIISKLPNTSAHLPHQASGNAKVAGRPGCHITSWDIELSATREGTDARWFFEIELEHWNQRCCMSAEAGFQGKYGPMGLRELPEIAVSTSEELLDAALEMVRRLFSCPDSDIQAAIAADKEEQKRLRQGGIG